MREKNQGFQRSREAIAGTNTPILEWLLRFEELGEFSKLSFNGYWQTLITAVRRSKDDILQ